MGVSLINQQARDHAAKEALAKTRAAEKALAEARYALSRAALALGLELGNEYQAGVLETYRNQIDTVRAQLGRIRRETLQRNVVREERKLIDLRAAEEGKES